MDGAFDKAVKYLSPRMRTKAEVERYLAGKGYPQEEIADAVARLAGRGYIDDVKFVETYLAYNADGSGERKLRARLARFGADADSIETGIAGLENQEDNAARLAERYMRGKERDAAGRQKLTRFLQSRGFTWEQTESAVRRFNFKEEYDG